MRLRFFFSLPFFLGGWLLGCSSDDASFEFALMGDAPYLEEHVNEVRKLIAEVNDDEDVQWVIHLGDTKGGSDPCDDAVLRGRFDLFDTFEKPFLFTPGDNDWYDCIREGAGVWDRSERLNFLRSLYFSNPTLSSAGREMAVTSQSRGGDFPEFVENQMWSHGDVVFATVHMVRVTPPEIDSVDAGRRMEAAAAWISRAFEQAKATHSKGVFLATQVDPWPVGTFEPAKGIEPLYGLLAEESVNFDGQVVLAVGDTHIFRIDKPVYSAEVGLVENFTRVEVFGEPVVNWVRVRVDPGTDQLFTFYQEFLR